MSGARKHSQFITINARALAKIADEGDNLYKSVSDLVLYATGAAACSTSDLILVLSSINQSLDNIKKHLNKAYFDTWKYIQVRIGYWKRQVYRAKTKQEIILNKAYFDTWKYIQVRIGYWKRQVYRATSTHGNTSRFVSDIGNVRCIVLRQNRRLSKVLLEDGKELATSDISS